MSADKPVTRWVRAFSVALALASIAPVQAATAKAVMPVAASPAPNGVQLEARLQALNWPQFRSVIEAVPHLKAEVDSYGALGWQFVQAKYRTHRWRKSIDRMDEEERRQLAELIRNAQGTTDRK